MNSNTLWYKKPAENWDEALPIGNGRLGAMVFGGLSDCGEELLQLNEDSIWSGVKRERNNKAAFKNLETIRNNLLNKKVSEAEKLALESFVGTPAQQRHYQPLGNLKIFQSNCDDPVNYTRSLDLDTALCEVQWESGGVTYKREVIASQPDNIIMIKFSADEKGKISFHAFMDDGRDDDFDICTDYDENTLIYGGSTGIDFFSVISASSENGEIYASGGQLVAEGCDSVTVAISCRTSFYSADYENLAMNDVRLALRKGWDKVKSDHIKDYQSLYNRSVLKLWDNSGLDNLPTDERLERLSGDGSLYDNKLIELYWNFGRYLMISGSREGTLPLNLQGIWNKDMWPAWGSKYTININTEMNYWCADEVNLSQCHRPLFDLIERMRENGRKTAKDMYGCNGFVAHHNTDIWGDTAPQDKWLGATTWPTGGAWLCLHIFEHYKFTGDRKFLEEKYDTLREAAEFFVDFLIENSKGELVTCPSVSPENTYILDNGEQGRICIGPTMDTQIIRELFTAVIESGEILGVDEEFTFRLKELRSRLPENKIGKYGQIMEWAEDYEEAEPGHRHISQLFGLYPASQITKRFTPQLARAAETTIDRRLSFGGGHTGWSRAWIINMRARLLDGNQVYDNIMKLITQSTNKNMFDSHPPFQIDGNFGGTAGITEAILQSHSGEIRFIPALPLQWKSGKATGLVARGGFEIDLEWNGSVLTSAKIVSKCGNVCKVYSETPIKINGADVKAMDNQYVFDTVKDGEYIIST